MVLPMFVAAVPDTQIRDGHVHVFADGMEYVITVHVFRAFVEEARLKLDRWDRERRGSRVLSFGKGAPK